MTQAELAKISNVNALTFGDSAHSGAIVVTQVVDTSSTGAGTVTLGNNTGGIDFNADFRIKAGAILNVTADDGGGGAIRATGGGTIFAPIVNFSANAGIGTGSVVAVSPGNDPLTQLPLTDTAYLAPTAPIKLGQSALISANNHGGAGGVFIQSNSTGAAVDLTVGGGGISSGR